MLAIIGASGKIGSATLSALLSRNLLPKSQITTLTSSQPDSETWRTLASQGVQVRHATFDSPETMETALQGITHLFLVSSPRIQLDFNPVVPAPPGQGREKDHFVVLEAARKAGVKHVYYTSLAFANPSKSNVMTAHERTETRLREMEAEGVFDVTILREGLYGESWPLYLGYFDAKGNDERKEVVLADEGDGKISWTSIRDLGIANALILADSPALWRGKCVYLSRKSGSKSMKEIAQLVGEARGEEVTVKTVDVDEHVRHYAKDREMPEDAVQWWVATYAAIKDGECEISDSTFDELLTKAGVEVERVESTISRMMQGA